MQHLKSLSPLELCLMRLLSIVILSFAFLAPRHTAWAQDDDTRKAQVAAATADAVEALKQEIYKLPIDRRLTVKDLVVKTKSEIDLVQTLQRAEQIGGPRWIDENTCQVKLEISGLRVARVLNQIAVIAHERSPVTAQALQNNLLRDINTRTFSATGSSTGARVAEELQPAASDPAWANVPEAARRQAVMAARENAAQSVIQSLRPIELSPKHTIGQELDAPNSQLKQSLNDYLASRPVTSVQFKADRQVELVLSAPPSEVAEIVTASIADLNQARSVNDQIVKQMAEASGSARAAGSGTNALAVSPVKVPSTPPKWADSQLTAEGGARVPGSALKSQHRAETTAMDKLRVQVEALKLTPDMTLGQAAKADPRFADAIDAAVARAKTYKLLTNPDGSVLARMSMNLDELWMDIRRLP